MVGDFGWEHEGTECQVDTVNTFGKQISATWVKGSHAKLRDCLYHEVATQLLHKKLEMIFSDRIKKLQTVTEKKEGVTILVEIFL